MEHLLKVAQLKLALSGQSFAHIRTLLLAAAKTAMADLFCNEMQGCGAGVRARATGAGTF